MQISHIVQLLIQNLPHGLSTFDTKPSWGLKIREMLFWAPCGAVFPPQHPRLVYRGRCSSQGRLVTTFRRWGLGFASFSLKMQLIPSQLLIQNRYYGKSSILEKFEKIIRSEKLRFLFLFFSTITEQKSFSDGIFRTYSSSSVR